MRLKTLFGTGLMAALALQAGDVGPYEASIRRNVGVGLGTRIMGHVGDGLFPQIFAATTNGSFGNQTFAVSTGTLGADQPGKVAKLELEGYLQGNLDSVARDLAQGRGENLQAVMDILAVPAAQRDAVAARLQNQFAVIFPRPDVTHTEVAAHILDVAARA